MGQNTFFTSEVKYPSKMNTVIWDQYGNVLYYSWMFCTGQQLLPKRLWLQNSCSVSGRKKEVRLKSWFGVQFRLN